MTSIFSGLIISKMRIRILMRIFLNPKRNVYLRELFDQFQASPSHINNELDQLYEDDQAKDFSFFDHAIQQLFSSGGYSFFVIKQ